MSDTDHPRMPREPGKPRHRVLRREPNAHYAGRTIPPARKVTRQRAIDEGLTEYDAMNPRTTWQEDHDPFWKLVWARDRLVIENFRIMVHLEFFDPCDPFTTNHLLSA